MKLIKKITAAVTAMTMAASMMSIGASAAQSWSVYFYPAQAPSGLKYISEAPFSHSTSISSFYDSCTNYTQSYNYYGTPAYVDYYGYYVNGNGVVVELCNLHYNYYNTVLNLTSRALSSSCPAEYAFIVRHHLNTNGNNCSMSGSVSLTNP